MQAVQTLSRPPRHIQRRHCHRMLHGRHGRPRASPWHARLHSSRPNLQTAVDPWYTGTVYMQVQLPFAIPVPRETISPSGTTRVTRSRAGSDTILRSWRIPLLTVPTPHRKPDVETRTRLLFLRDVRGYVINPPLFITVLKIATHLPPRQCKNNDTRTKAMCMRSKAR